jgi:hypothetical protein
MQGFPPALALEPGQPFARELAQSQFPRPILRMLRARPTEASQDGQGVFPFFLRLWRDPGRSGRIHHADMRPAQVAELQNHDGVIRRKLA